MTLSTTDRGFTRIEHPIWPLMDSVARLVQESSSIGNYEDAMNRPGSSFLWIGEHFHLNRRQVAELISHLQRWLATGRLALREKETPHE